MKYYKIRDYFEKIEDDAVTDYCLEFTKCASIDVFVKRWPNITDLVYGESIIKPAISILKNEGIYSWDLQRLANYCEGYLEKFIDKLHQIYIYIQ